MGTSIDNHEQSLKSINDYVAESEQRITSNETSINEHAETIAEQSNKIDALENALKGGGTGSSYAGIDNLFVVRNGEYVSSKISMSEMVKYLHACVNNGTIDSVEVDEYVFSGIGSEATWVKQGTKKGWEILGVSNSSPTIPVGLGVTGTGGGSGGKGQQAVSGATGQGAMASANHSHPYTFADVAQTFEDGSATVYAAYADDGKKVTSVTVDSVHPEKGSLPLTSFPSGKLPFPARADHRHPLNVVERVIESAEPSKYLKPIGATADFGQINYYARVDHVHPVDKSMGALPVPLSEGGVDVQQGVMDGVSARDWLVGKDGATVLVVSRIQYEDNYNVILMLREMTISKTGSIVKIGREVNGIRVFADLG